MTPGLERRIPTFLKPTDISNERLAVRFARHPGPYTLSEKSEGDMERIFPGITAMPYVHNLPAAEYGESNQTETYLLYKIITWQRPRTLIEIGTFKGRSTRIMAEQSPGYARILTVDLPNEERRSRMPINTTDTVYLRQGSDESDAVGIKYRDSSARDKITQVRIDATSPEFKKTLDDFVEDNGTIDFAYVDPSHDYETTRDCFLLALEHLSPGGIILADDYNKVSTHVGVTRAYAELADHLPAKEEGLVLYYFNPKPAFGTDQSGIFFLNVPGAIRDWKVDVPEQDLQKIFDAAGQRWH